MNPPPTPLAVLLNPRVQTVRAAREVGARTLMVGPDLTAPGMSRVLAEADQVLEADWRSYRRLTAALSHLAGARQTAVFGFERATALAAARANFALRLPGSSPLSVAVLSDALALRERVNELTGASVRFEACERERLPKAACQVGFPCTVRPRGATSADDAVLLRGVIDAEVVADRLPGGEVIVEEYLDGPRVLVEAHSHHGTHTVVATTPPLPTGGSGPRERVRRVGARADGGSTKGLGDLGDDVAPAVHRLVADTLDAADYAFGPSLTTIALTAHGPRLVASGPCTVPDSTLPAVSVAALLELRTPAHRAQAS
ncbi:hypothetical protein GL263_21490 [Streptomyces durbertensis]|uniref:ATP-grasp domain-containing protein n=1 Tax=Streptomyces durbertensis TaxID=2448886 RepID=A0ABR6EM01_9ACTN|nr:hypothetical protein [Streptomyces durbertensis]MBB1246107.1 hypothetical protein [Streptomyces durbertensis]